MENFSIVTTIWVTEKKARTLINNKLIRSTINCKKTHRKLRKIYKCRVTLYIRPQMRNSIRNMKETNFLHKKCHKLSTNRYVTRWTGVVRQKILSSLANSLITVLLTDWWTSTWDKSNDPTLLLWEKSSILKNSNLLCNKDKSIKTNKFNWSMLLYLIATTIIRRIITMS